MRKALRGRLPPGRELEHAEENLAIAKAERERVCNESNDTDWSLPPWVRV